MAVQPSSKKGEDLVWPPKSCFSPEILEDKSSAKKLLCRLCGKVCLDAMEMCCDEHDDDESAENMLYGAACMKQHLANEGNKCPIGGHPNADPKKSKLGRSIIANLDARCPLEVKVSKKKATSLSLCTRQAQPKRHQFETKNNRLVNRKACKWTGKVKEIDVRPSSLLRF